MALTDTPSMTGNALDALPTPADRTITVCQILHSLNLGGAEVLAHRLATNLGSKYRFVFACLDEVGLMADDLRGRELTVEHLQRRPGLDLKCARRLADLLRREEVDVVHAHQYTPYFYSVLSGIARRPPPILFNEHGRFYPDSRSWKRVFFNRLMLRRCDRVVAVGNSVARALVDNEGIPATWIRVIYNGVALPELAVSAEARGPVRNELQLRDDEFAVFQVARLDSIKDHATALRTMARVVAKEPRARLFIVGDGPERERIRAEVQRLGIVSHVTLMGQRTDVSRLLCGADLFLLTSVSEGIPVTLIEAMGASLPIVGTNVGGMVEVVEPERTGLLAPAGADDQLSLGVLRLLREPALRDAMGQAGRERAEAMFTEARMHAAYSELYEEMACARPRR